MPTQQTKTVHPFFQKKDATAPGTSDFDPTNASNDDSKDPAYIATPPKRKRGRPSKQQKEENASPSTPSPVVTRGEHKTTSPEVTVLIPASKLASSCHSPTNKRRRFSPPGQGREVTSQLSAAASIPWAAQDDTNSAVLLQEDVTRTADVAMSATKLGSPEAAISADTNEEAGPPDIRTLAIDRTHLTSPSGSPGKPEKTLKLNGYGGFGTPSSGKRRSIRQKQATTVEATESPAASPNRAQRKGKKQKLLTILRYGVDNDAARLEVGKKIETILATPRKPTSSKRKPDVKAAVNPAKAAHPFFVEKLSKSKPNARGTAAKDKTSTADKVDKQEASKAVTFSTPGKLRAMRQLNIQESEEDWPVVPRTDWMYKAPGTVDPAWPSMHLAHVPPPGQTTKPVTGPQQTSIYHKTRRKARAAHVELEDDLIRCFTSGLRASSSKAYPFLRIPSRHVMTGQALRERVCGALFGHKHDGSDAKHPAIQCLLDRMNNGQTAFDRGRCESQAWTQKYAPKTAGEVLQAEKEMRILKDWLESQTVSSTRVDLGGKPLARSKDGSLKRKKKRRKLADELDGFIVDDDDDHASLRDLSDEEGSVEGVAAGMRSLVQDGSSSLAKAATPRKANAVLVSGPHGCGKSAAVYAVAQELGFEVFEIGPNTRRSGKDIMDRVGDMTRYHQVSRNKQPITLDPVDGNVSATDEADALPTERSNDQSALTAFFPAPTKSKANLKATKPNVTTSTKPQQQQNLDGGTAVRQQQALILLEEVDILFDQDKQFWETVVNLAMVSRRPIVMTCNDESRVPIEALSLHALLRFRRAAPAVATSYLTLLAASEGHLLDHRALERLFEERNRDLRATLTDLQFWCQMAIGDTKGGLNWYLPQHPRNQSYEKKLDRLRVVSEDTYTEALIYLDPHASTNLDDGDLMLECWNHWSLDPAATTFATKRPELHLPDGAQSSEQEYAHLWEMEMLSDMMSAVDVSCQVDLPLASDLDSAILQTAMDPTQPPMSSKSRNDHPEGSLLLDATPLIDYPRLDAQIYTYVHAQVLHQRRDHCSPADLAVEAPDAERSMLLSELKQGHHSKRRPPLVNVSADGRTAVSEALAPLTDPLFDYAGSRIMSEDIAPYARSIARYDSMLEQHRSGLNEPGKKARTTRASRSALEGSQRSQTRRERWFGKEVNLTRIIDTAGPGWPTMTFANEVNGAGGSFTQMSSRESSVDPLAQ